LFGEEDAHLHNDVLGGCAVAWPRGIRRPLAAEVITDRKHRRNATLVVWGLALSCVLLSGLQLALVFRADRRHETEQHDAEVRHRAEQDQLTGKLERSMQHQEYMRGQLDSIGLMVGKLGESRSDPALAKLAESIGKMSNTAPNFGSDAPRRLGEPKRNQLSSLLSSQEGRRVVIYIPSPASERDRKERQDYARDLQRAFEDAHWNVIFRNSEQADLSDYTGLLFVYDKGNPPSSWPDFSLLKKAFDQAEIKYTVAGLDAMDIYTGGATTADPVVYIGEK
jgi:hypothetical protein